jgi:hypothetical protein
MRSFSSLAQTTSTILCNHYFQHYPDFYESAAQQVVAADAPAPLQAPALQLANIHFEKQNINRLSSFVVEKSKQSVRLQSAQFGAAELQR